MHPAIPFAVTYGPQIAGWVLRNPGELGDAFERISRPIMRAVTDPTASIDRIGSTLVSMQGGQTEVIGLLHQHTVRMDGIAAAVDDVGRSVGQVGEAVGGLTALTMVGLGFSALSQAHIAFQFARVNARLDRMAADVKEIHILAHADLRGAIEGGLAKREGPNRVRR